jgi:hypothetical protein
MRPIFITIIFLTTFINTYSQNSSCCYDSTSEKVYEQKIFARLFVNSLTNNNLQYLNNWAKGKLYLESGEVINNELLRLNRHLNEVLWLRKSDYKTGIIEKKFVQGFSIEIPDKNEIKNFRKLKIKNWYSFDSIEVFVELLAEGDLSLGIFRTSRLNKNSNELTLKDIPYIIKDGKCYNIKATRGSLYSLPFIDKALMKSIIKSNHLKVRKEEGLKDAIDLYNKQNAKQKTAYLP